ncbi:MAG: Gfo/Idh/MocA family oxidoreductase [Candidatus Hydrogenedentes bacterium]|nr:Gfo/Idh/MocA family oxidoreductase [Candidatus Hydrogenedentota bacterium]
MAADPDVQGVVAAQPHLLNGHIAIPLLKAGKSCFVEKPMAGSLEEAEEMVEAARIGKAQLMVGFMKRYDSGVNLAKRELDRFFEADVRGQLCVINAYCFGGDWLRNVTGPISTGEAVPPNPGFIPRNPAWMTDGQKETFNLYMNIFSHNLNLIRYLFPGRLETKAALLRERKFIQSSLFESEGTLVNLYGMSVNSGRWEERTELYFNNGWVRVMTPSPMSMQEAATVEVYEGGEKHETRTLHAKPYWAFRAQADHFVECLKTGSVPRTSGEDSLEDMRLMEDVFRKAMWV